MSDAVVPQPTPGVAEEALLWPTLSVVTPSLDQARFLEATIRSILSQGYPNLEYLVSMGIYVFSSSVREYIPRSQKFDFPDLVQRLLTNGQKVLAYESDAYWMDIGRPDDYQKANEEFPNMEKIFFKAHVESAAVGTRI